METAGQARLAQRGIHKKFLDLPFLFVFIPRFGYGRNRSPRGELLSSSLHRGDTESTAILTNSSLWKRL